MGEVREKRLRELAEPDVDQRPLCIVIHPTIQPFELKLGLIHILLFFKGNSEEDPHKIYLKDSMRPHDIRET